ncbi:MAG: ferritin family protein [Spirochaetes bacterium]|nr:ferritin family protein [Spirochaetota bacterium]
MTVYEQAKNMEVESRKVYESLADLSANPGLKSIFTMLAKFEQNHYDVFDAMEKRVKIPPVAVLKPDDVKKIFRGMKKNDPSLSVSKQQETAFRQALAAEEAAVVFYRAAAEKEKDGSKRAEIISIVDEEKKHALFVGAIIELITRPAQWIENAEWNHLDEY